MTRTLRLVGMFVGLALVVLSNLTAVGAADGPDFTKFGYPTVAKSMDITPDQAVTITAGDHSVAIKAGTFDGPVTFDLLTSDPSTWKDLVKDRTVRAAFAFRVTDKATKAILATFKQPVTYSYAGKDAQSTDVILNTTAATPPVITVNATPPTFDGKVNHGFGGAGVGWLVASAPTTGAASSTAPAAAASSSAAASPAAPASGTTAAATLPKTGEAHATGVNRLGVLAVGGGIALLLVGTVLRVQRRTTKARR